ncbi:MAG TPA: PepSY domain-containing protein [Chthoniobacterales bacterium]|jgi:uncharacterized membrane protein YkoI
MKLIRLACLSVLISCATLAASPANPPADAKITKNEAEHIALKQFPHAHVTWSKLEKVSGQMVWSLEIAQPNGKNERVTVDAMSGRVISPAGKQP